MAVSTKTSPKPPKVGSRVSFLWGFSQLEGKIVEDRGAIGVGGRRLYRIEAPLSLGDQVVIELPESKLELKEG